MTHKPGKRKQRPATPLDGFDQGPIPEELVDAFFDGELDVQERRELRSALRRDPRLADGVARTERALAALRGPVPRIDVTEAVLERVERRRRFLPSRWRLAVRAGRLGVAAGFLLLLAGVAITHRVAPELLTWRDPGPEPVATLMEHTGEDYAEGVERLATTLEGLRGAAERVLGGMHDPAAVPAPRFAEAGPARPEPPERSLVVRGSGEALVWDPGADVPAGARGEEPGGRGPSAIAGVEPVFGQLPFDVRSVGAEADGFLSMVFGSSAAPGPVPAGIDR